MPALSAKVANVWRRSYGRRVGSTSAARWGRLPDAAAEVVQVEITAPWRRKQQRRVCSCRQPVERLERDRLQRHRAHAATRLGTLQSPVGERPAHIDDPRLTVEIAPLERGPFAGPQTGGGGEHDHRPVDGSELRGERVDLAP
jgi:hypothetical protein